MHFLSTLSTLALSATLAHTAALPVTQSATAPLQRRNGCYSAGELSSKFKKFSQLHGSLGASNAEVASDITTTRLMAKGTVLKPGQVWTRCSEWASTTMSNCKADCIKSCGGSTTFPGSMALADMSARGICTASCPSRCKGETREVTGTGINRIDWAIKNEGDADATVDFDACNKALNTELGGCDFGSEQSHDGFWYRIDPNEGKCGA